jgi:hypothetical protein
MEELVSLFQQRLQRRVAQVNFIKAEAGRAQQPMPGCAL